MAKKPPSNPDNDIFTQLAKSSGGDTLANMPPVKYYIDSGNLAVNCICSGNFISGGYPGGRIIEIVGPSMGGKSLWGCNFVRGVQQLNGIPIYLDAENAMNAQFAEKASHLDPHKIVRYGPKDNIECLEKAFLKVHNVIRKVRETHGMDKALGFVYDSLSVSPSARELRETEISEDFTEAEWKRKVGGKEQPGERARIINKELRKLESTLEKTDTTMYIIQQLRKNIGVVYGKTEVSAVANDAMEYYCCCRLRVSAHKKIENKLGKIIGVNLKIKNIKNRITAPFVEAEGIQLYYEKGVNPLSGLIVLLERMERIVAVGKGSYAVKEPWAGGNSVTFKASKTANLIDEEILYKCPALIDAKDEQQIRDYLAPFRDAIQQTLSEDNVEKDVSEEEGGIF